MSKMTDFATWILKELEDRDLTQTDLAEYLGISRQAVNYYIMKGSKKHPSDKVLFQIAKFFKISPETIYRNIGIFPKASEENEILEEINYLVSDLPKEDQVDVREYVRHRMALAEKRGKSENKKRVTTIRQG